MNQFPEANRDELVDGFIGLRLVVWQMNPVAINALASVVPERGEQLWQRSAIWIKRKRRESEEEEPDFNFFDWVKEIFSEHQIDVPITPPSVEIKFPLGGKSETMAPTQKRVVPESVKRQLVTALRNARDHDDAKREIKSALKRGLHDRPQNSVSVNWSTNADDRSATVWPSGYESFSITTRLKKLVVPEDVKERCVVLLHGAADEVDAKRQISAELRHSLRPSPEATQFMINWSEDRKSRSASVVPHQFEPFFISTSPRSSASPNTPTELELLAGDNLGLQQSLPSVNDALLRRFYSKVPERGDALWTRFMAWRDAQPDAGGSNPINKWIGTMIMADLLG